MQLHPIMYVPDQYAEREFYARFGFTTYYEGDEFPGFLAIQHGDAIIGLQKASEDHPPYTEGLRWQFVVETREELDSIVALCGDQGLRHDIETELAGTRFKTTLVKVQSPGGAWVWFEGPNEMAH